MRRERKYNGQQSDFGEFLLKGVVYYLLGSRIGLKGNARIGCAIAGPVAESITNFPLLESIGEAIKRQEEQKEFEEKISRIFERPLVTSTSPKAKLEDSIANKLLLPPVTFDFKMAPPLTNSKEPNEPDIRWLDLIIPPSIVLLLGGRGTGKTALGFRLLEIFRYKLMPYVIGLPSQCVHLLPDWIGINERLEDVPSGSISLVDEAYISNHARDWTKAESKDLCQMLNLSRQQDKTVIFIAQQGRQLNLDIASSANVIVLKNPGLLQAEFERPALRQIVSKARLAFENKSGDRKKWSYVYSPDAGFNGLVENSLPTFWSQKLSRMYGQTSRDEKASEKHPSQMPLKQKKQKAKELYKNQWSLSRIAKYFGVSKSTVFNWIRDYPYPKK
jgi:hypothetical protein